MQQFFYNLAFLFLPFGHLDIELINAGNFNWWLIRYQFWLAFTNSPTPPPLKVLIVPE